MRSKHATKLFLSFFMFSFAAIGNAQGTFVAGPIEKVSQDLRSVTVLGQTVAIGESTAVLVDGKALQGSQSLAALSIGNFTFIAIGPNDETAQTISTFSSGEYVAGASTVALAGKVTSLKASLGILSVGTLKVDVSSVRPELLEQLRVGSVIQIAGLQPNAGGVLVGPVQLSIGGSGVQRLSIGGSGVQSISIGGSGIQKMSIGGSGIQKISIGGSGVQKVSIGGSGAESIGGSGTQKVSIGGSGAQKGSIGGSGITSLSIGGSGLQ